MEQLLFPIEIQIEIAIEIVHRHHPEKTNPHPSPLPRISSRERESDLLPLVHVLVHDPDCDYSSCSSCPSW